MDYFYLISSVALASTASVFGGFYNRRAEGRRDTDALYNLLLCGAAFVGWVVLFLTNPVFDVRVLPYAAAFGVCYVICEFGFINALRTGPVSLSTLLLNLALIATTIWGFFFWNTEFSLFVGLGLGLVVVALWLCLYTGRGEEKGLSLKWLFYAALAFAGNSGCAIIQRTQVLHLGESCGNLMMACALFIGAVFCLIIYLRSDRRDTGVLVKSAGFWPVAAGLCNVLHNFTLILLANSSVVSSSVVYPCIAVGSLSITIVFSLLAFRERLRWWQWAGIACGTVAVVLLSI
jgi:drug/metabolite transporter (DMT)-like permease